MGLTDDVEDVDTDPSVDVEKNEQMGTVVSKVARGAPVWSSIQVQAPEPNDESTEIDVAGYWKDDEPPQVEVRVLRDYVNVNLDMSPERARTLAAELMVAANRADEGADGVGGDGGQ